LFLICPFSFFYTFPGVAQNFDPQLVEVYNHFLDLRLREEPEILHSKEFASDENKALQVYIKNLGQVLDLLLVKDEDKFNTYQKNERLHYQMLEKLNGDNPFVAYLKIELKLHHGLLKLRYGDRITGAFSLIQAFRLINNYEKTYTDHPYTLKTTGLLNVIISLFPDQLNWLLNIMQVHPDITKGVSYLKELSQSTSIFRREGSLLYALSLSYYTHNAGEALVLLKNKSDEFDNSLLYKYLYGLISIKNRNNLSALQHFDSCLNFGRDYLQVPLINYYRAESYLKELNFNRAAYLYKVYLEKPDGDEYIKDSYYKLYNLAVLFHIPDQNINVYKNGVLTEGSLNTASDNYAYTRIVNNYHPDETLFKSRVLFDGGYYKRSLEILESQGPETFSGIEEVSEYLYRYARNYQQLDETSVAVEYFNKVIAVEGAESYYFWGNSLLHLGNICIVTGEPEKAREFYKEALRYKGEEYRNSIRMEAKMGLKKMEDN